MKSACAAGSNKQPVEWKGEVTGAPAFFPLATVDLLVAGQSLTVFDKENHKLFDSQLSYPVERTLHHRRSGRPPHARCRTRQHTLFF